MWDDKNPEPFHVEVKGWDMATGRQVLSFRVGTYAGSAGGFISPSMAVNPDGKRITTLAGGRIGTDTSMTMELKVRDVGSGVELFSRKAVEGSPEYVGGRPVYSPDGRFLALGYQEGVRLMDANTHAEVRVIRGSGGFDMAFSPDSKRLATGNAGVGGGIKLWDIESGREIIPLRVPPNDLPFCLAFSPDGYYLAAAFHTFVKIWDARPLEKGP